MKNETISRPYRIFVDGEGKKYVKKKGKRFYFRKRAPVQKINRQYNDKVNVDKSFSNYIGYLKGNITQQQTTQNLLNKGIIGQQSVGDIINIYSEFKKDLDQKLVKQKTEILGDVTKLIDYGDVGTKIKPSRILEEEEEEKFGSPPISGNPSTEGKFVVQQTSKKSSTITKFGSPPISKKPSTEGRFLQPSIISAHPPVQDEPDSLVLDFGKEGLKQISTLPTDLDVLDEIAKLRVLKKNNGENFSFDEAEYQKLLKETKATKRIGPLKQLLKKTVVANPEYVYFIKQSTAATELKKAKGAGKWDGKRWGGLYNTEIDLILRPIAQFINYYGTICLDEIPNLLKTIHTNKFSFIYNTAKTTDGEDKQHHWIAVYSDGNSIEVYDALGDPIKKFVKECFKIFLENRDFYLPFKFSNVKNQGFSANCGFFAIKFLVARGVWKVPFHKITGFKSTNKNEENIENLKENYKNFGFI